MLHNGLGIAASKCGRFVCGCAVIPRRLPLPMDVPPEAQVVGHNLLKSNHFLVGEDSSDEPVATVTCAQTYSWPRRLSSVHGMKRKCLSSTMQSDSLVVLPSQHTSKRLRARLCKEDSADEETKPVTFDATESVPHLAIALIDSPESSSPEMDKLVEVSVISSMNLEGYAVRGINSVSFSPSGEFVMIGCGYLRDNNLLDMQGSLLHLSTSIYRTTNPMTIVGMKEVGMDNINVACFSSVSGLGSVYGTTSGRLRIDQP